MDLDWLIIAFAILFIIGLFIWPVVKYLLSRRKLKTMEHKLQDVEGEAEEKIKDISQTMKGRSLADAAGFAAFTARKGAGWMAVRIVDEIFQNFKVEKGSKEEVSLLLTKALGYYQYRKYGSEREEELRNSLAVLNKVAEIPLLGEMPHDRIELERIRKHVEWELSHPKMEGDDT
ncbi:MAG: hypothetical protein ACMUHB_04810 [Thermoplasmatota archaeon]